LPLNKCLIFHFTQSVCALPEKTKPTKYCFKKFFLPNAILLFNLNNAQKHILLTCLTH